MLHILSMARKLHMFQTEENKQKGPRTHNSHMQPCRTGEIARQTAEGHLVYLHSTYASGILCFEAMSCDLQLALS